MARFRRHALYENKSPHYTVQFSAFLHSAIGFLGFFWVSSHTLAFLHIARRQNHCSNSANAPLIPDLKRPPAQSSHHECERNLSDTPPAAFHLLGFSEAFKAESNLLPCRRPRTQKIEYLMRAAAKVTIHIRTKAGRRTKRRPYNKSAFKWELNTYLMSGRIITSGMSEVMEKRNGNYCGKKSLTDKSDNGDDDISGE
ncbi:unnamed protein product [Bursaphelenchus xylophilus]|uniref:(pine wood nematode) hypothetical protein n=1 Tax=Bursaphelenchus xylophilus TaxID=6326 RepID=A0A1I7RJG2_BURXY|nr:unnamed protein product [Bursaphelenchus xylophilus]CAG9128865.1 unnamed protein product [Bursaphelenchus xylophilus]